MTHAILVRKLDELTAFLADWRNLAQRASEANVFYEPEFLLPCLQELGATMNLSVVLVFASMAAGLPSADRLIGLFPFRQMRTLRLPRLPILRDLSAGWRPHIYLSTPLVHREHAAAAVDGVLDLLDRGAGGCALLEWHAHGMDGPFAQEMMARIRSRGQPLLELPGSERALFRRQPAADAGRHISVPRRKKLDSQRRRLERAGAASFERLAPGAEVEEWITDFLALEASGWKGRSGTALANGEPDRRFFARICRLMHAQGRLLMHRLTLDGRTIAMNCMLLAADGKQAFSFKVAYDERFARFSPGTQLKLHVLDERQRADDAVATIDSCAPPDSALWSTFHLGRRHIGHVLVGANRPVVRAGFAAAKWALDARGRLVALRESGPRQAVSGQP